MSRQSKWQVQHSVRLGKVGVALLLLAAWIMMPFQPGMAKNANPEDPPFEVKVSFISISPDPLYIGQAISVSMNVASLVPAGGVPAGKAELILERAGTQIKCSITLDSSGNGQCLNIPNSFSPGVIAVQAIYLGQAPHLPGVSPKVYLTVNDKHHPTVAITSDLPDPSIINRLITAAVEVTSPAPQTTGQVTIFRSDATCTSPSAAAAVDRCSASLDSSGAASCGLTLSAAGKLTLCAAYEGNTYNYPAVSPGVEHRVSLSNTFTTITQINPSPSLLGQSVMVSYSVTSPDGSPSGQVVVTSGPDGCSGSVLDGKCQMTFSRPHLQEVVAAYSGGIDGQVVLQPSYSEPFTQRVNVPPYDLLIDNNLVAEDSGSGVIIARLSARDLNLDEKHTFSLVSGAGSQDNSLFAIDGDLLRPLKNLSLENRDELSIRVRATDPAGLTFEKIIPLRVTHESGKLPKTGFAPGRLTRLPEQPAELAYSAGGGLHLSIPALDLHTEIVGVPRIQGEWQTEWLGAQAGWLHGTAFPTWPGNSALAGHSVLSSGTPGPFTRLETLRWGDRVTVEMGGETYTYEVRSVEWVQPEDLSVLRHEQRSWLTLITCKSFDEARQEYRWRVVVRAILVGK